MRRTYGYLLMISLLVLATAAPALSDTYFIYNQYGGTWHDANKTTSPDDDLMCWAAAVTLAGDSPNGVPIAPSWVLFGTGAAALFLRRGLGARRV